MAKVAKTKTKQTATAKKATKKPKVAAKSSTKKRVASSSAAAQPFMQVRITDQTLYWLIFGTVSILFAMWVYSLDAKVRDLYDQIDINSANEPVMVQPKHETTDQPTS